MHGMHCMTKPLMMSAPHQLTVQVHYKRRLQHALRLTWSSGRSRFCIFTSNGNWWPAAKMAVTWANDIAD